jgi:hypothetical protein
MTVDNKNDLSLNVTAAWVKVVGSCPLHVGNVSTVEVNFPVQVFEIHYIHTEVLNFNIWMKM